MSNKKPKKTSASNSYKSGKKEEAFIWLPKITGVSKNARRIYLTYIFINAYCILTIFGISDRQLILNEMVYLPILNFKISLFGFFFVAPILIIIIFYFLQMYLYRLKGLVDIIKNHFSKKEIKYFQPWLINIKEGVGLNFVYKHKRNVVNFSLWWTMPLVFMLLATWFIKKHYSFYAYILGILPILGTLISILFWGHYDGKDGKFEFAHNKKSKVTLIIFTLVFELFLIFVFIPQAHNIKFFCVDLSHQILVEAPKKPYQGIYWVDLRNVHLECACLTCSVLKHADLRGANFRGSVMDYADLEESNLDKANFQNSDLYRIKLIHCLSRSANFSYANLIEACLQEALFNQSDFRSARLYKANFQKAVLSGAKFQSADLSCANLQDANLFGANFQNTILESAVFQGADLREALFLNIEQLSKVKTLYMAKLDPELMEHVKEKYPYLLEKQKEE